MPGVPYDSTQQLRVHVVSQSPHTFAYKLWIAKPGATAWSELDRGTIETPPREYGPLPADTRMAYTLLVGGNPETDWRVHVMLSQPHGALACTPEPETGVTNASGVARRDTSLVLR
jgi:hypothetical protein